MLLKFRTAMKFRSDRARWGLDSDDIAEAAVEQAAVTHRVLHSDRVRIVAAFDAEGLTEYVKPSRVLSAAGLADLKAREGEMLRDVVQDLEARIGSIESGLRGYHRSQKPEETGEDKLPALRARVEQLSPFAFPARRA